MPRKSGLKLALGLLVLGVAAFGSAEVFFRVSDLSPENADRFLEPYLMLGNYSGSRFGHPEDYGYKKRGVGYYFGYGQSVQSIADRNFLPARSAESEARTRGIYIVGGSVAMGVHATDRREWWRTLERTLREETRDSSIRVYVDAMSSWVSTQERLALEFFVFPSKPKAVVVLDGVNDMMNGPVWTRPGDPFNQGVLYARYYSASFQIIRALSNHSAVARYFLLRSIRAHEAEINSEVFGDPVRLETMISSIVAVYLDNVTTMAKRCVQEGVPCYFLLQPVRSLTDQYMDPRGAPETLNTMIYSRLRTALQKKNWALWKNIRMLDLTHLADGEARRYYTDEMHFSDPGQDLLATRVSEILLQDRGSWSKR